MPGPVGPSQAAISVLESGRTPSQSPASLSFSVQATDSSALTRAGSASSGARLEQIGSLAQSRPGQKQHLTLSRSGRVFAEFVEARFFGVFNAQVAPVGSMAIVRGQGVWHPITVPE
ncbi:MAG: hypothetical protein ACKVX9_01650 [Blastocatellia bacterium]